MIEGLSGCSIEVKPPYIIKRNNKFPASRLSLQAKIQANFSSLNYNDIIVPKIHSIVSQNNSCSVTMDYYPGQNMVDFLETASIPDINWFLDVVFQFIGKNITESVYEEIYDPRINEVMKLPIGKYHGDFTLSNMIVFNKKIVLFDFLDSIKTPFIDIAKLRQDTFYRWSFFLTKRINSRLDNILKYLDKQILEFANSFKLYQEYGPILEKSCLKRILPYCKNHEQITFIEKALCQP